MLSGQTPKLSDRLRLLQWALPAIITLFAALYQLGPAYYIHRQFGEWVHYLLEILFYGTTGPIAMWLILRVVHGWVKQKERAEAEVYRLNAELQRRVEDRTRELREKNVALSAANEQLKELDRLKSEFVSLVSHELRAPLTNVRGAIELMEGGCPALNPTCARMFQVVAEQIGRLGRMVDDVLNVSHIEAGGLTLVPRPLDALQAVDRVLDEFAARDGRHRFQRSRGEAHPRLWADPDRLHEVLTNLVDNAVKYSPAGTDVRVAIEIRDGEVVLSVADQGAGIPAGEQARIFEKFHRLDSADSKETYGYGLGLYLCRRLVKRWAGGSGWRASPAAAPPSGSRCRLRRYK